METPELRSSTTSEGESDASASDTERPQQRAPWMEFGPTMCGMLAALEEQVQRRPMQAATLYRSRRRTFAEVDRCSARLAEALRAPPNFAEPADVAACTAAPDDTLVAFLACLRLSACCTPIRPSASSALLASIMEELPPACTVVDNDTAGRFAKVQSDRTLNISDALQHRDDGSSCWDRPLLKRPPSPATRHVSRRPLLQILGEDADGRCALGAERCLGRNQWEWSEHPADRETVAVLDCVDTARFWEDALSALCAGATVALPTEEDKRSPSAMLWFLRNTSATRVEMTPDLLWALLRRVALDPGPVPLPELRLVKCSRGLVTTQLVHLFQRLLPGASLVRVYEKAGHCCSYVCHPLAAGGELRHHATDHGDLVTIGKPVGDCRAAVCEADLLTECPQGKVGTICIGGAKDTQLLPSGDKGFVDSDGYIYLTERSAPRIEGRKVDIALSTKCLTDIPVVSDGEVSWERLSWPKVSLVAFYWSNTPGDTSGELFRPLSSKLPSWKWMPLLCPLGPPPRERPDKRQLLKDYADAIVKLQRCGEVNVTRAAPVLMALARSLGVPVGQLKLDASYVSHEAGQDASSASEAAALLEHIGYEVSAAELGEEVPLRHLVERAACTMVLPGARRLRVSLLDANTAFDEVADLLARSFTSKNRLDLTVHNTEEQHRRSLRHLWPQLIADAATRLVREADTGKLLAVAVCCDFSTPQTAPANMAESFLAIAELNESMEQPLRAAVNALDRRLLLWFMVGTGTDHHADNVALVLLLMANTLRDAKALRYHGVCSINSHLVTNVITQCWFQFDVFDEAPVAGFEYCGRQPFANIRTGTLITSVCKFLDPS
ncbi:mycosubtilin synthase subunit C-like isoform X1 [Dermacentor andersoni]|uniref:mycosubtilin synthase subunit C-like isoform X1 n=2 Tax=Dermacentor andersoni TaxID=34620 RepID=UPI0024177831|nr:uncharacterized protein LOC126536927 isoform X1 [Dermacentor andersoni]